MEEKRKSILIIYDAKTNVEVLRRVFRNEYRALEATGARQALEVLRDEPDVGLIIISFAGWDSPLDDSWEEFRMAGVMGTVPVVVVADYDDVEGQIEALDFGAEDVISRPFNTRMILHRVQNIIERRKAADQAERSRLYELRLKQQDQLQKLYEKDDKSGIYNRRAFCEHVRMLFRENSDKKYVIFQWDVDRFKVFNDLFGVAAGDKYLAAVGESLDSFDNQLDVYGRWDADDFVCCMEYDKFDPEQMLKAISGFVSKVHDEFEFVVRMGIYIVDDPMLDVELMCDRAQLAMRTTKGNFSKQFAFYTNDMRNQLLEEQEITSEMSAALSSGQFDVYFQPQYNHSNGTLYGAEALVRWIHPTKGVIYPNKFIPIFEGNGFISQLDEYVWERTCALIRSWLDAGIDLVPISVNISRCDIYNPNLCDCLMGLIKKYDIDISLLRLEITETVYMESPEILLETVRKLRAMGFFLEMDDFGSGYSSLNTLKEVPVDMLKLDLKFVESMNDDERGGRILSSIIRMAHWIKLQVIAEGVETKEQADFLKSMGCSLMQGFYFAKPMPSDAFEILLKTGKRSAPETGLGEDTEVKGAADFLDAGTQTTLLFNSFVGGAAIIEYDGQTVEALRINDKYFDVINTTREEYAKDQFDLLDRFEEPYRSELVSMLSEAVGTGGEAEREVRTKKLTNGKDPIWLRVRVRYLYKNMDSFLFYLAIENTTEQIELIEKNRDLSQNLSSVMASVPGGICRFVSDDQGIRMTYFNDNTVEMFGYDRDEFEACFAADPASSIHPDDIEGVLQQVKDTLNGNKQVLRVRCRTIHKNGEYAWVQFNGHVVRGEGDTVNASAILIDIDDQVKNEILNRQQASELEQQRLFLTTLYDNIPCGILRFKVDEKRSELISCNETAWKIFGYDTENEFWSVIKGIRGNMGAVKNFYPEDVPLIAEKIRTVVSTSERIDFDHRIVRNDGTVAWLRTILQKTTANDGTRIVQCVYTDINQQKESELQKYSTALFAAYDEIYEFDFEKNIGSMRVSKLATANKIGVTFPLSHSIARQCDNIIVPAYRQEMRQFLDVSGADFQSRTMQFEFKLPSEEEPHWGELTLLHTESGTYLACTRDITAAKNASMLAVENELLRAAAKERRAEDERNRIVVDTLGVFIIDYDPQTDHVLVHRKNLDGGVFDVSHDGYAKNMLSDNAIAEEDRQGFLEKIKEACGKPMRGRTKFRANFFQKAYRLCNLEYVSLGDENGKVYRVVGVVSDIQDETDRQDMLRSLSTTLGDSMPINDDAGVFAASVFRLLDSSDDLDKSIDKILEMLAKQFKGSRAYIIEESEDGLSGNDTYEWHDENTRPGREMFQNLHYNRASGKYRHLFDDRGLLVAESVEEYFEEPIRSFILKWGARSIVQCAITDGDRFIGYLGLDDCTGPRKWTQEQLALLSTVTSFVGAFLLRRRKAEACQAIDESNFRALDDSAAFVYIVDENMKVLDMNSRFAKLFGAAEGRTCHEVITGQKNPCEICPVKTIRECSAGLPVELVRGKARYISQAGTCLWNGKKAFAVTCVDNPEDGKLSDRLLEKYREDTVRFRALARQTGTILMDYNFKTGEAFRSDTCDRYCFSDMSMVDLTGSDKRWDIVHPADRDNLAALMKSAAESGQAERLIRLMLRDGSFSWTKVGVSVLSDEQGRRERLLCTLTDYDEQIDLQRELEAVSERSKNIIANVPAGIAIFEIGDWVKPMFVSDRACELFGFTREEYDWRIATGEPVNFVPDITDLPENALDCVRDGVPFEVPKIRAKRKNGGRFWLRVVCSAHLRPDGTCICYTTLSDVTSVVEREEKDKWQAERYRLLSEAANVVTFDYDPSRDILELSYFTPEKGVVSRSIRNHLKEIDFNSKISDESRDAYKQAIIRVGQVPSEGIFDIKAQLNDDNMRWYRANYVSVGDNYGNVFRVVGRIDDINDMMLEQDKIRRQASMDGLTGVLNKETSHSSIDYMLRKRPDTSSDALMVIDIDEFKAINDQAGHMEGDRVLTRVGEILRTQFRSNDILGRFGGDEFVVYMRSVGYQDVAAAKAESIIREVSEITLKNRQHVSCSIGLTFITGEELYDFEKAFSQADYALYVSKNNGKDRYTIYDHASMGTEISNIGKWREE